MVRPRDARRRYVDLYALGHLLVRDDRPRGENQNLFPLLNASCSLASHFPLPGNSQLMTGEVPFKHIRRATSVPMALTDGQRPERPSDPAVESRGLDDRLWALLARCWAQTPEDRPDIFAVNDELDSMRAGF